MAAVWRLILHPASEALWNMAVDEALLLSFAESQVPVIRFYTWERPSISLGRFQNVEGSVNLERLADRGVPLVRRPTGGRAVLHGTDLTLSVVKANDRSSVSESYRGVAKAVAAALIELGAPVEIFSEESGRASMRSVANCFDLKARFEVALEGRKVLGCAQLRTEQGILQQNSLLMSLPNSEDTRILVDSIPCDESKALADYAGNDAVTDAICHQIEQSMRVTLAPGALSDAEIRLANELVASKYESPDWIERGSG